MKVDDIRKIAYNHSLREIKNIKNDFNAELELICKIIDSRIVSETCKNNHSLFLYSDDLYTIFENSGLSHKQIDSIGLSNWLTVIGWIYRTNGFQTSITDSSLNIFWNYSISIDDDIDKIFNKSDDILTDFQSGNDPDNESFVAPQETDFDLPSPDDNDDNVPLPDTNDSKSESLMSDEDISALQALNDASENLQNTVTTNLLEPISNDQDNTATFNNELSNSSASLSNDNHITDDSNNETINALNEIYNQFEQYFGKSYLSKETDSANHQYQIYLQIYENKCFKYFFVWSLDYAKHGTYDTSYLLDYLSKSLSFAIFDKMSNTMNEANPLLLIKTKDALNSAQYVYSNGFVDFSTEASTMLLPIIRGYLHSKKRMTLFNQSKYITNLNSLQRLLYKQRLKSVLWIDATAPNSLSLNTYHSKHPELSLIANSGACRSSGIYFHKFDWSLYRNPQQANQAFYRYVWHEAVNLYYFKQDWYLYNHIFDRGDDRDFRDAFVNYSVDCRLLATKANIVLDKQTTKDMTHGWSTSRTPTPVDNSQPQTSETMFDDLLASIPTCRD